MKTAGNGRPAGEARIAVFLDLDDSIFQTARKCGPGLRLAAALGKDGEASSFFSAGQRRLLDILDRQSLVIPTTARNRESFSRVLIDAEHGAILNHGGSILRPDGRPDSRWQGRMRARCLEAGPLLAEARTRVERLIAERSLNCRARIISDDGLDFYLVAKNYDSRPEELEILKSSLEGFAYSHGLRVFLNGNNLSLLPPFLDKAGAVAYFLETYLRPLGGELLVIGLGDSLSDLRFLRLCDLMLIPSRSQLGGRLADLERP